MAKRGHNYDEQTRETARILRSSGKTHREISKELEISLGSAALWTKGIKPTLEQKAEIEARRNQHTLSKEERVKIAERLRKANTIYSKEILLQKIKDFQKEYGRIPLKHEFNQAQLYGKHFGSWNNAIKLAGFKPNPTLFSEKQTAKDGHMCDSVGEKIIDELLTREGIKHIRSVRYGTTKYTADFVLEDGTIIEYFGLAGAQEDYDRNLNIKRNIAKEMGVRFVEIYQKDILSRDSLLTIISSL